MSRTTRHDRSVHQVRAENPSNLTLGQLREVVRLAPGIPDRATVIFGAGSEATATARSLLVNYEGELEVDHG